LGLYFFLSYAHGDRVDEERVASLFADLSTELRTLTGDDHHEVVGFHDFRNLRAGDAWPRELTDALSTARTFVALCEPRYFRSRFCGKEWTVFARRVAAYQSETGQHAPSIIPVIWVPQEPPPLLADIHYRDESFGQLYHTHGLRELIRLEQWQAYNTFVGALAARIRHLATTYPLPAARERPDFHVVPNAFETDAGVARAASEAAGDRPVIPAPRPKPAPNPPPPRPILNLDDQE
jgi:hypothetical protein